MNIKKILIILLTIFILIFFTSNISALNTIDHYAYVMAIGLDKSDEGLNLHVQLATQSIESKSEATQSSSSKILSTKCVTIEDGINLINAKLNKKLNFSYCKAIIFYKELAISGVSNIICSLTNDIEIRPSCSVIVAKCDPKTYLEKSEPTLENLSSKYYESERIIEKNTGFTEVTTIMDFYNKLYNLTCEPYMILADLQDDKTISEGLAIFKSDKFIGELNSEEALCHLIISNKLKHAIINIPNPFSDGEFLSINIDSSKCKIKINNFDINCQVKIKSRILSSSQNINYMENENRKKIDKSAQNYINKILTQYLNKISKEYNSDIDCFGSIASRSYLTSEDWNKINWLENFKNTNIFLNSEISITSSYLLIN